jgi:hypothetical protein
VWNAWVVTPQRPCLWLYAGLPSYEAGDLLTLHISTDMPSVDILIGRDGARLQEMARFTVSTPSFHPIPVGAARHGCGWPATITLPLPSEWPSGGYVVTACSGDAYELVSAEAFFVLRARPDRRSRLALIASNYTWAAYNNWGGGCFYPGSEPDDGELLTTVSLSRPWARGQVRLPVGAPTMRITSPPDIGWAVRHPFTEWARATGHSRWAASGGWAAYDSKMVRWLEQQGFDVDLLTQWDIDRDPTVLDGYLGVITCGHDEYWTALGRSALAAFIDSGGWHARFAGNIIWQVRADVDAGTVTCWKFRQDSDPESRGPRDFRTGLLEGMAIQADPTVEFGGSGVRGGYSAWGGAAPRGIGGFVVYRPDHWAFDGADLYYGDVLGAATGVLGYECDGVGYTMVSGLPQPAVTHPPLDFLEILALSPASFEEEDHGNPGSHLQAGTDDLAGLTKLMFGADTPDGRDLLRYGSAVITEARRGRGGIFCAGSTGWPDSLASGDRQCARVTANVLNRILS